MNAAQRRKIVRKVLKVVPLVPLRARWLLCGISHIVAWHDLNYIVHAHKHDIKDIGVSTYAATDFVYRKITGELK